MTPEVSREEFDALLERVDDLESKVAERDDRIDELEDENERLQEDNERLQERVDDLEQELDERAALRWDSRNPNDIAVDHPDEDQSYPLGARANAGITETDLELHLEELKDDLEDGPLREQADAGADGIETETPLEDVVALPENIAEQSLSPNQDRARFVASNPSDYGDKVPAGRRITAGRVGRILRSGMDVDPHPETVRRVMQIIEDLADGEATVRKKNAEKRIILDEDLVARLERLEQGDAEAHSGMSGVSP